MNRMKKKREVKYSKLYDCSQIEQDDYWKQFLESLSRGKSVKRLILNDGNIEFVQKGKSFVYHYKDKSPDMILPELKELFRQKLHIHSKKDIYNNQYVWSTEQNELSTLKQQDDWKKIRNKNMRYFLIMKYSISLKHKHILTWKTANILFKIIYDALFTIHTHKSIDITMENGEIINVKDIIIDKNKVIHNTRIDLIDQKKDKKDTKTTLWDKYLMNTYKMYSESNTDDIINCKIVQEEVIFINNDDDDDYETFAND